MLYNTLLVSSYIFMYSSDITLLLYVHKYSDGCDAVFIYEGGWWTNTPYSKTHFISSISLSLSLSLYPLHFCVSFSSFCVICWTNEVLFTSLISGSCEGAKKWTAVSASSTFQDLPRLRKTAGNTERYIWHDITWYSCSIHKYGKV